MTNYYMRRQSFRFRQVFCTAAGVRNIPALEVVSGHGYGFTTYICTGCGAVVVIDDELLHWEKMDIVGLIKDVKCAVCERALTGSIAAYPQFILHDGHPVRTEQVMTSSDPVTSQVVEVFTISKR